MAAAVLLQLPVIAVGVLVGWGGLHVAEQRQRARMREILKQDAQRPFASAPPR